MALPADLELAAQAWIIVLSGALLILALVAYRRSGKRRMLLLGLAFGLFLVKGVLITLATFQWVGIPAWLLLPAIFDTLVLVSLYAATLR